MIKNANYQGIKNCGSPVHQIKMAVMNRIECPGVDCPNIQDVLLGQWLVDGS
jgi:hypothetical protein